MDKCLLILVASQSAEIFGEYFSYLLFSNGNHTLLVNFLPKFLFAQTKAETVSKLFLNLNNLNLIKEKKKS